MDDKLFALKKNLELLELRKGVCELSWQTEQVLGLLKQKSRRKGKHEPKCERRAPRDELRESKYEIDMLILDMEMGKVMTAIKKRELELEAMKTMVQNQEFVVIQEEKVSEEEMIFCPPEEGELLGDYEPILVQEVGVVLEEELTLALGEKEEVVHIVHRAKKEPCLLSSSIIPLECEPKQHVFELAKVYPPELCFEAYISVFNKLMSRGVHDHEFYIETAPMIFRNTCVFKKGGVLSTMMVLQANGHIHVLWLMYLGDSEFDHKDLRANPFEEGEIEAELVTNESSKNNVLGTGHLGFLLNGLGWSRMA